MAKRIFIMIITGLLISLFIYIAVSKMLNYNIFRHILTVSPLIGSKPTGVVNISVVTPISTITSVGLLIGTIWTTFLLVMPSTRLLGFYGSTIVLLVITMYLGYVVYFVSVEDYPFSGVTKPRLGIFSMTWKQLFVFNIFFLILSIAGILLQTRSIKRIKERELPPVVFT